MKNILIVLLIMVQGSAFGQTMTWIPSKHIVNKGCTDMTNCTENIVCYKLQYIPNVTGKLTSYTTGFIADCENGETKVKINQSCLIEDKSNQTVACEDFGKILLNCSGNSGAVGLKKGIPVILHQICLDAKNKNIGIVESDITKLTTSIDIEDGSASTEFVEYENYIALNTVEFCENVAVNLELNAELIAEGKIHLEWEPARESIDGVYYLQRSYEGDSYEDIYKVNAQVISALSNGRYTHLDEEVIYGEYRYRVAYEDESGNVSYSNVADVFYKNRNYSMVLFPNPTVESVNIFITAPSDAVTLMITDMAGALISTQSLTTDVEHILDLSTMLPGLYNITINSKERTISKKLILVE